MNKQQMIDELIERQFPTWLDWNTDWLAQIVESGWPGFVNLSKKEIKALYKNMKDDEAVNRKYNNLLKVKKRRGGDGNG